MADCIFCKIAAGHIPAKIVYEDDLIVGFEDINPQGPVHVLMIPREHVGNVASVEPAGAELVGKLVLAGAEVARDEGIEETGYRLVLNVGPHAGESVPHLHLHVIGGRQMAWPPG
ncbi:MAG: histidine triad nucleotide-binding protein [Armatimonadetes bacterium]|nr:histidine triad nucleotide-binding protein [Armatimonadota bacterium]